MKKTLKFVLCFALAMICSVAISTSAKADYVTDSVNGVSYENKITGLSVGYAWSYGSGSTVSIHLDNSGDRVMNVRSNSSSLVAKKVYEQVYTNSSSYNPYTSYRYSNIGVFAKKAGKYTVSFDVVDSTGTVKCTKTIYVTTSYTVFKSGIKSIKYANKPIADYYPFTNVKSGKLSVVMKKGYKLISLERRAYNNKGEYVSTPIKNNKKLKLATKEIYSNEYTDTYNGVTSGSRYAFDDLFPSTSIKITYMNTKTKEEMVEYAYLHTMNKKNTLMKP